MFMLNKLLEWSAFDDDSAGEVGEFLSIFRHYVANLGKVFRDSTFVPGKGGLVNSFKMSELPWKRSQWARLYTIFPGHKFCHLWAPRKLFDYTDKKMPNMLGVLTGLSHYPHFIKECIFPDTDDNPSGAYIVYLHIRGRVKRVLVDDLVPIDPWESPQFLEPPISEDNWHQAYSAEDGLRKNEKPDIWPQLITKALAKEMINYERVTLQNTQNLLRDITGMPTRTY